MRYLSKGDHISNRHILFIHGLGSSADRWLDIPDALSQHYHTMAVDLIGFGGSDKPEISVILLKNLQNSSQNLVDKVGLDGDDGKITVVGHSLGGYIAVEFAIRNKDLIEKPCVNRFLRISQRTNSSIRAISSCC